jgi:rhodanese-related sulfurtransferase
MKLMHILLTTALLTSGAFTAEFIPYKQMATKLLEQNEKEGLRATTDDVKKAIKSKDTAVVDVRTPLEWAGAHIKGTYRVGRQIPEMAVSNFVLNDDDKLVKDKLIVICNTAHRASIQAVVFRHMGFKEVKVYPIDQWIDECNPVATKYSGKEYHDGKDHKFGEFYAEGCKK